MPNKRTAIAHDKEVGKRIKVRRLQLQMSQQSLGNVLDLTFQQVQKYEKGMNRVGAGRLQQIAKALKISPSYFFNDGGNGAEAGQELFELLDSAASMRVMKAFAKIEDPQIRRSTVELLEAIAGQAVPSRGRG